MAKKLKYSKNFFEKSAWQNNLYVCGIDEVGRGCLAGPLVVAACILPINTKRTLKDSKILTAEEREKDCAWLVKRAWYSTCIISPKVIDKINIYNATLLGMKRAFAQLIDTLPFKPEQLKYLVVDAMPLKLESSLKTETLEVHNFPFGESISSSIAAASIIAKVTRDHLMDDFGKVIPGFDFEHNKGYGTKSHLDGIDQNGISIIHRTSFISGIIRHGTEIKSQQSLF